MRRIFLFITLIACSGILSAQGVRYIDEVFSSVKLTSDIKYGENLTRTGQNFELKMDIYEPVGDTENNRILIIIAHEGGFLAGSKTDIECDLYARSMAKRGYVVASIDYRLGWVPGATARDNAKEIVPALWRAMQDGKAAVRYFHKSFTIQGNPYKIDTGKIVTGGFGAGAYIFIHNEYFDVPNEFNLPKLKDPQTGKPWIDTTQLGGFEGESGNPGYPWRSKALVNYAGAIGDTLFYVEQRGPYFPPVITCQGDRDQTTPFGTAIVFAAGQFPVLEVSGGYEIARKQYQTYNVKPFDSIHGDGFAQKLIKDPNNRGFEPMNLYKMGTLTFLGQDYQPWAYNANEDAAKQESAKKYMDSVVRYTAWRLHGFFHPKPQGIGVRAVETIRVFPNPNTGAFWLYAADLKGEWDIDLRNMNGQVMFRGSTEVFEDHIKVSLPELPDGLYEFTLTSPERLYRNRFVIRNGADHF